MAANPKRRKRGSTGRRRKGSVRARHHTDHPERFAPFETAYKAGERISDICRRLHLPRRTGENWARNIRVEIGAALRAMGLDELSQARKLLKLQAARMPKWNPAKEKFDIFDDGATQLAATREISRLLDHYPAPKEDQPAIPPVQLIFRVDNLILPGEQPDYHNEQRLLDVKPATTVGQQDRTAADPGDGATE